MRSSICRPTSAASTWMNTAPTPGCENGLRIWSPRTRPFVVKPLRSSPRPRERTPNRLPASRVLRSWRMNRGGRDGDRLAGSRSGV